MSPMRRKPRLLIVEDDADLRVLLQFAAKRSEMYSTICTAEDGASALEQVRAGVRGERADLPPDVVFTDYTMPRADGLEVAAELRRDAATAGTTIALFTGELGPEVHRRALALGCCAIYPKPANFRELLRIMRALPTYCRGDAKIVTGTTGTPFAGGDRPARGDEASAA
jgi:CheY-like chemotaxis protein